MPFGIDPTDLPDEDAVKRIFPWMGCVLLLTAASLVLGVIGVFAWDLSYVLAGVVLYAGADVIYICARKAHPEIKELQEALKAAAARKRGE